MSFPSLKNRRRSGRKAPRRPDRARDAGTAAFNTLVTSILVAILISTGMTYYLQVVQVAREVALRYELASIRTSIVLFQALNHRLPGSLQEMVEKEYLLPSAEFSVAAAGISLESPTIFKHSYLEPNSRDAQGRILDPFGKPYRYNVQNGQVTSTEERHENW